MARMKDFKDKLTMLKEKFKTEKSDDQSLKLCYDTNVTLNNVFATKEFCAAIRRIGSYGIVTYSISPDDKKTKRKSLNTLSLLFSETSIKFQETDPMRGPLNYSAMVLAKINIITIDYEKRLQLQVIEPLSKIEINCNEIQELRKKLHEMNHHSATLYDKLERMADQSNFDEQKVQSLKDQIEEVEIEFENISDLYLHKILQFEASKFEQAQAIHAMVLLRIKYHQKCCRELLIIIPEANQFMEERRTPFSFRYPLENHLREIKKCIAYPIEKCVSGLSNTDHLRQEGLFRVSGSQSKSNLLCCSLNIMKYDKIICKWSPHVFADAMKRYLRELPVKLLSKVSYGEWSSCYEKFKSGQKETAYYDIKDLIDKMPKSYYNNVECVVLFLNKVIEQRQYNLMNVQNICTLFTPNLFAETNDQLGSAGRNMEINVVPNFILESLLNHTKFFFPPVNNTVENGAFSLTNLSQASIAQMELHELSTEDNTVTYRVHSEDSADISKERLCLEHRLQRRRQRCLDVGIFNSERESISPPISIHESLTSISSETNSTESYVPIVPPRRHRKN